MFRRRVALELSDLEYPFRIYKTRVPGCPAVYGGTHSFLHLSLPGFLSLFTCTCCLTTSTWHLGRLLHTFSFAYISIFCVDGACNTSPVGCSGQGDLACCFTNHGLTWLWSILTFALHDLNL